MPCFAPVRAFRARVVNPSGKRSLVFRSSEGFSDKALSVACGKCAGCRAERARQWAVRCYHESKCHDDNCFVTLTYAPEFLPANGSLVVRDFQLFMKKLRKRFCGPVTYDQFGARSFEHPIRFFACGEYGDKFSRPHYHALLFGHDFDDKVESYTSDSGDKCYSSAVLDSIWGKGRCELGSVTFQSAAYVARYIDKKVNGLGSIEHYGVSEHGEVLRIKEFILMSRRPGIGYPWLVKFYDDIFPNDYVIVNGVKTKPPTYYTRLASYINEPEFFDRLLARRGRHFDPVDNDGYRLRSKELVAEAGLSRLSRRFDDAG